MSIRSFNGFNPNINESAYIDEDATVIGKVEIGEDSSVWPRTSIRGDLLSIKIGKASNIQDCSTLHTSEYPRQSGEGFDLQIGDYVTIGHGVVLHGCQIRDKAFIGMGSIILDGAIIESEAFVGAGSLVPSNKTLESGYMYFGSPVKKIRKLTEHERKEILENAKNYIVTKNKYKA